MNLCIIGTGYVGLVSAACFAEMGNNVCCIDNNSKVVELLNAGKIHIYEPGLEAMVARNIREGRLTFSMDLEEGMENSLFLFNCVGTPPKADGSCDLTFVHQVASEIGQKIDEYKIVVNKSTVPVGTADSVREIIEKELKNRSISIEFDVVSNPEFLKEGDAVKDFMKPDRVIVGTDNVRTAKLLETLYAPFARSRDKMIVMSNRSAELAKYAANCMLATKISFMNEIANICEEVGADVSDIRRGIGSDRRIGYHFIYPGLGYGGSCFPKDVKALIQTARENAYTPQLIESVDQVNNRQKLRLAKKIETYFADKGGLSGKTLAIWGLSFKPKTDDMREAPALEVIQYVTAQGMACRCYDPVSGENARAILAGNDLVTILDDQYEAIEGADTLAVITEWNQFRNPDFNRIKELLEHQVIFDGRNLYDKDYLKSIGLEYFSIGRP